MRVVIKAHALGKAPRLLYAGEPLPTRQITHVMSRLRNEGWVPHLLIDGKRVPSAAHYAALLKRRQAEQAAEENTDLIEAAEVLGGLHTIATVEDIDDDVRTALRDLTIQMGEISPTMRWSLFWARLEGLSTPAGRTLAMHPEATPDVRRAITRLVRYHRRKIGIAA